MVITCDYYLIFDDSSMVKTLGIRWNAMTDTFYYEVKSIDNLQVTTKTQILSNIALLFDPLGRLCPTVVVEKLLMQDLKIDWDEAVPQNIQIKWNSFCQKLMQISSVKIRRWVHFKPYLKLQIHGFCDASEKAYSAAIYVRIENTNDIHSHLLAAKIRVAPLKPTTIPKLKPCGAQLLT